MAGAGSAAVSGAGTPVAGPAGRDLFAEGLLEFLRPAVQQLDSHVHAVRCAGGKVGAATHLDLALWGRDHERAEPRWMPPGFLLRLRMDLGH